MAAEAVISSLVKQLGDLLIQKVKFLRGVEGKVELLKGELTRMQSFLKDASKKQAGDERVRNWISEIREVAYDAEDAIEMFVLNVGSRGILGTLSSLPNHVYYVNRVGKEIESILARLDDIDKSRERYGIKDLDEAAVEPSWRSQVEMRRRLSPWQKDEHLVGIEADVEKLLRPVLDKEKKGLFTAVIEGMGGIGKSTLARALYNHPDVVADGFDFRGWVVVSSEFTPRETIKQLISGSEMHTVRELEESMSDKRYLLEKLKEMLHKQLEGKSYLIVLDDVWEKEDYESLVSAFPNQQDKRSRLLVTSRNKIITKSDQFVHKMKGLDLNKSWELFMKKTNIGITNGKCPKELESIGLQILEKCHGLPLAISIVGGLLMETQTKNGWEQVLNQINSYLGRSESMVSSILELSYHNLSPQLKSCFLCLSFFKEDSNIPAKRLVSIWVGQGLIQHEDSRTTDEIARCYLNELINRTMVQVEELSIDDLVESCSLHDLVREVCLRKAKEEIGLEIEKGEEMVSSESSCKPRHRVVYDKNLETPSWVQDKYVRSLFLLNSTASSRYWKSFQLLKTLNIDGLYLRSLPKSFRSLLGLKYLRVHRYPYYTGAGLKHNENTLKLPWWLDELEKLEVVEVENIFVRFPKAALKMEKLRYFHAFGVKSRVFSIDNWKHLESLKMIRFDDWLNFSSILVSGCRLRELGIYMERIVDDHKLSRATVSLEEMTNLVELHIHSDTGYLQVRIIPQLNSLTKLELHHRGFVCPDASMFPPNLSHLTLNGVHGGDPMEELAELPKLQYLKLSDPKSPNSANRHWRMKVMNDGFPCLKALSLSHMRSLERIDVEEGGMPRLQRLQIRNCPNLETRNLPKHINVSTA